MGESDASVQLTKNKQHILMSLSHYRVTPLLDWTIFESDTKQYKNKNKNKNKNKKKKNHFLTTYPILSPFSPDTLSNDFQW